MKYSPKVNEALVRSHKVTHLHPWQDDDTAQGILEAMYRLERIICEISGMDRASFQPGGGTQAVYANARMIARLPGGPRAGAPRRDHHDGLLAPVRRSRAGDGRLQARSRSTRERRPAAARRPEGGAVASEPPGLMITNPEDTGIFNPHIDRSSTLVQAAGGICHYDQANANGILGITRARDAGLRPLPVQPAQDVRLTALLDGHAGRRLGRLGRARRRICRSRRWSSMATATSSTTPARTRSARCARSTGCPPRSYAPMRGSSRSAPKGCARWPRSRC